MNIGIYEQESKQAREHHDEQVAERRLWTAVLLQTMEDWQSGNIRLQNEAAEFLFDSQEDFERVCSGAGLDSSALRSKLRRMRPLVERQPVLGFRQAA